MLNIEYEEDGSVSMKADFQEFGMQDPKQLADDRALNFATSMAGDYDVSFAKKAKTIRDPMSHRVIEKRRRDRMNNCLADLSRLIPSDYLKQGQGRIEKTEIIEMAIKHIKNLTNTVNKQGGLKSNLPDRYLGFKECQDEMMRFLVEVEGWDATDRLCIMLMGHLEQAGEKFRIMNDQSLSQVAKEEQYRHADEELNQQMSGPALIIEPPCPKIDFPKESPLKAPVPFQPKIIQQEQSSPTTQQATLEGRSAEIPQTYTAYDQALTAQQITQEHLKRDKHLWTLLTSNYNSQVEDSGISVESQMSKSNSNGERDRTDNGTESSYRTGTECSSAFNSKVHESSSEKLDSSVYKFKHNITKRFSQEVRKVHPSDTSSSSSRETNCNEKVKRKMRHVMRCRSPSSSGSSKYPKSSSSTNNSSDCGANTGVPKGEKIPELLPCFVLHTSGTHYVPMSIHPSSVGEEIFNQSHSCIYHPISIPVNFGGPVMYMKKAGTPEVKSESPTISSESADSPSGLGSKENSFGNLWAEASPISQT